MTSTDLRSDPPRLAGRRAVITGAARGIGAEIARTYAAHGASVAVLDVLAEDAALVAKSIGGRSYEVDLTDPDVTRAVTQRAIDDLGGIDVLVNNAGILRFSPLLDITVEEWDLTFDVNVRSMLLTTQVAARAMIAAGQAGDAPNAAGTLNGKIVNMASMGGKVGSPKQAHYAASKAAVISLTRVAAMELGPHSITVNCLCPGYVLTEMGAATRTPEMVAAWSATSPLGRCAEPSDVAGMALFLASPESDYCTGQAFNVTGGMVMH